MTANHYEVTVAYCGLLALCVMLFLKKQASNSF